MRVSMEFQDASLRDVLKTFSQQTGINVIASGPVSEQTVTLYLEDVTVLDAFDQILRAGSLTYERMPGSDIYVVNAKAATPKEAATTTRVYRLKYARVSKSVLAQAAATFGARTPFEASHGAGKEGSGGGGGTAGGSSQVGIDVVIKELVSDQGSVVVDGRTNSLIVTDLPERFPHIEAVLAALDVRTPQILVDAEVVETSLNKLKDLGFEWGTGSEGDLFQLTPAKADTKLPFTNIFGHPFGGAGLKHSVADPKITLGSLDSSKAIGVLQALEIDGDTKVLARPKVLTLDNESAVIRLTTNEAIGFTTSSQSTTGTQSSEPEREMTGVILSVTPQVNEAGYITMLVEPSVTKTVQSQISAPANQATPRDPNTRSARAIVRVRSGDTLVVGGLIDRTEEDSVRKVPVLAELPFIGSGFKNTEVNNRATELVVFVTPRILDEPGESKVALSNQRARSSEPAQKSSAAQQDAIERSLNSLERQQRL